MKRVVLFGVLAAGTVAAAATASGPKKLLLHPSDLPRGAKRISFGTATGTIKLPRRVPGRAAGRAFRVGAGRQGRALEVRLQGEVARPVGPGTSLMRRPVPNGTVRQTRPRRGGWDEADVLQRRPRRGHRGRGDGGGDDCSCRQWCRRNLQP